MNLVNTDSNLKFGKVVGGMFITGECPTKRTFEVNMYPVFTDSEGNEKVLMMSMYKKKFNTSDIHEMNEKIEEIITNTEGQNIRNLINVTRIGNVELSVVKDIMSYEVLYNGSLYMTLSDTLEKGYSMCFIASRKAPKYIEAKDLVYLTRSNSTVYFFYIIELKSRKFQLNNIYVIE